MVNLAQNGMRSRFEAMPLFEPEPEIPSMADNSLLMFHGELPAVGEPNWP